MTVPLLVKFHPAADRTGECGALTPICIKSVVLGEAHDDEASVGAAAESAAARGADRRHGGCRLRRLAGLPVPCLGLACPAAVRLLAVGCAGSLLLRCLAGSRRVRPMPVQRELPDGHRRPL